jgi:hypothetical protein
MTLLKSMQTPGKILLGAGVFFAGTLLGSMAGGFLGLPIPTMPAGADATTLMWLQLLAGFLFSGTLALVSRRLGGGFFLRWLTLVLFSWLTFSLNTYLEAAIFTGYEAASAYTLVMQFCAAALSSAVIAWFFHPAPEPVDGDRGEAVGAAVNTFVAQFTPVQWTARLLAALLAFPLIYIFFGLLARPFIQSYYEQQMAGLTLPGWGEILPTLLLRSTLFLVACLPVLITWQGTRLSLFLTLGTALFILVGGIYMMQSYWFPVAMRIVHGLEILADSFVYSGVLVAIMYRESGQPVDVLAGQKSEESHRIRTS